MGKLLQNCEIKNDLCGDRDCAREAGNEAKGGESKEGGGGGW